MVKLKRVGRYLRGRPRSPVLFEWQSPEACIEAYSDSDWAGDKCTRRSVSGGALMLGKHLIKTWSKQQTVVALSSAEAELYAGSKAGSEAIGMQTWLHDLGWQVPVRMHMDSSSALSLIHREGLGKAKHISIQYLWLQDAVKHGRMVCLKIAGESNPSDLMTKNLAGDRITYLMRLLGHWFLEGRMDEQKTT